MPLAPPLSDLPWYVLAAIPLVVLASYTVFGATGFGSSIVGVPLLAHLVPLTFAVPLATSLDAFAATSVAWRNRRVAAWPEIRRLLPPILIGIAIGMTLLVKLPAAPALLALGVFVGAYALYLLAGPRTLRGAPAWLAWPAGVVGGVFSALFGTGGPIYMIHLAARVHDKASLRATSAVVVGVSVWIRLALFAATGLLLQTPLPALVALLLPVMWLGLKLGHWLHGALSGAGVLRLIAALLLGNAVSLIARALGALRAE
jgi:uncharacterized membrane protein YfcA